jgi:regulator of replication initiation timing
MDKQTKKEFENLARMIKVGFDETAKKAEVDEQFEQLKEEILGIKADLEDIKLRMGEMVFRFEIRDFEKRLKRLEIKVGLAKR